MLVDQDHLDAAYLLSSQYKASITRCSRNRKKAQRAKLLLTLRERQIKTGKIADPRIAMLENKGDEEEEGSGGGSSSGSSSGNMGRKKGSSSSPVIAEKGIKKNDTKGSGKSKAEKKKSCIK